jgi:hypothetical protein
LIGALDQESPLFPEINRGEPRCSLAFLPTLPERRA